MSAHRQPATDNWQLETGQRQARAAPLARLTVAAVFAFSGGLKLADPARFLFDLQAFGLLTYPAAYATALVVPWLEILAAAALCTPRARRAGALWLGLLLLAFTPFVLLAPGGSCGCFGRWLLFPNAWVHLTFNATLLLLLIFGAVPMTASARRGAAR